jgi:hypothetical protein
MNGTPGRLSSLKNSKPPPDFSGGGAKTLAVY